MATNSKWQTTAAGLLPGIAWGLLVLALTLALLVLGAIVLPAQAQEPPAQRSPDRATSQGPRLRNEPKDTAKILNSQEAFNELHQL
jgi:uncharacterized membrane protein YhiD involved in acid resistance